MKNGAKPLNNVARNGSIIVVSDTHLGHCDCLNKTFSEFLNWVKTLQEDGKKTEKLKNGDKFEFENPGTMIMLGDILELWDPKECNPCHIFYHSYSILRSLYNLTCDKVYVLGNHDEALTVYAGEFKDESEGTLKIVPRHYPENPEDYLEVGKNRYFFIHGQQFDRLFCRLGSLSKLPTYWGMVSKITQKTPADGWSVVGVFAALSAFYAVGNGFAVSIFEKTVELSTLALPTALTGIFAVPRVLTQVQGWVWKRIKNTITDKPSYKDIQEIIDKKYYRKEKDTIKANVVVFGHTHLPELKDHTSELGKVFVNSGAWIKEMNTHPGKTFVYIDEMGVYLFRWHDNAPIEKVDTYSS
jgi:UDP-2,3-diacylglucosamine pyrophosphatase LpxH